VPQVSGQCYWAGFEQGVAFCKPEPGRWHLTLMLREWTTGHGFVTRDYRNFAVAYASELGSAPAAAERSAANIPAESNYADKAPAPGAPERPAEATVTPGASAVHTPRRPKRPTSARVSIQCGRLEDLAQIEGLELNNAQAIVKYRPYTSVDDLVKVPSIGPETLRRLRSLIRL
jgi:DNA uptake protein ComE-like DNA-binding protein